MPRASTVPPLAAITAATQPVAAPNELRDTRLLARCGTAISLIRPRQWSKNIIVVPIALVGVPVGEAQLRRAIWATVIFIVASATVYVMNDLADRHRDRLHPVKCRRPIASGQVTVPAALTIMAVLGAALVLLLALGPWRSAWPVGVYLALNICYTWWLKRIPLVDVFVVAAGFVLRVAAGASAAGIPMSTWLALLVFSGSLLLSLGKRRHESRIQGMTVAHRPTLAVYTTALVDQLIMITAVLCVMSFILHLNSAPVAQPFGHSLAFLATPLILFGVFRYVQLLIVEDSGGDPSRLLFRDRALVLSGLLIALCVPVALLVSGAGP
jgi:decaprenyl-phosphate phosphoribosyltransferase